VFLSHANGGYIAVMLSRLSIQRQARASNGQYYTKEMGRIRRASRPHTDSCQRGPAIAERHWQEPALLECQTVRWGDDTASLPVPASMNRSCEWSRGLGRSRLRVLLCPLLSCLDGFSLVLLPSLGDVVRERVVRVGCAQESLNREQNGADLESG